MPSFFVTSLKALMILHGLVAATVWFVCENLRNLIKLQVQLLVTVRCEPAFNELRVADKSGEWAMALSRAVTTLQSFVLSSKINGRFKRVDLDEEAFVEVEVVVEQGEAVDVEVEGEGEVESVAVLEVVLEAAVEVGALVAAPMEGVVEVEAKVEKGAALEVEAVV